jgi:hypothetical protein
LLVSEAEIDEATVILADVLQAMAEMAALEATEVVR